MSENDCTTPLKRCTKCGEEKPATSEYFRRKQTGKYGLGAICKSCVKAYAQQYYIDNIEKVRESHQRYREENADKEHERHRRYQEVNAERERERKRQWKRANPEQVNTYQRRWRQENPEKVSEIHRRYRETNAEKLCDIQRRRRITHPETLREIRQRYHLNNPDKGRAQSRRRRARKANLPATFTAKHERIALDYFNGCCAVCGRQLKDLFSTHTAAMDHWIPLSKGGATTPDNMVPLCHGIGGCNNSKHNRLPDQWLNQKFGKRKAVEVRLRIETYFKWVQEQS